ncbi:MAG TPA: ABC transporter ATP-binding protein [Pirellulales bacterium]|nr:ABC transporter ATP-binding protein [Pirellulales bacterium]
MIEFDNVTRRYGDRVAVRELNLSVPPGELFALLGPNGAGKTTAIKMLVGLLRPSSGHVRLGGYDLVTDPRRACALLGYVPDVPFLYDKLSGREFLHFLAGMYGFGSAEICRRIDREIDHFELRPFVDDLTETYSHGMKQRLVFAAALLHDPSVLVIDEPLVGLDPRSARLVKDLLRRLVADGMTVFMSTHLLDVAEQIADRIGIVAHGALQCVGTLAELRDRLAGQHGSLEQLFLEITSSDAAAESINGRPRRPAGQSEQDRPQGPGLPRRGTPAMGQFLGDPRALNPEP